MINTQRISQLGNHRLWRFCCIASLSLLLLIGSHACNRKSTTQLVSNSALTCGNSSSAPGDNPVAARYDNSDYPWTEKIRWQCVYNINDFQGATPEQKFAAAQDAAVEAGGGVVYFPAGTYEFTDSLYLQNGVVLRGETPNVQDAKSANYQPATKLVFPPYQPQFSGQGTPNQTAFKQILTTEPDQDSNLGLVNLDINRAGIELGGDIDNTNSQNIIIFGVRSNNVAQPDSKVPNLEFQQPWQRYSYRFAANISVNAQQNVLIANNRLNDAITDNYEQPGYRVKAIKGKEIITYTDGSRVPFNYTNHYGILANRSKDAGFQKAATPETEPGLFRSGITIRDNWVYHTMRVGISASGQGLVIKDNQVRNQPQKQWWTDPTGLKQPRGSTTLENRAIDWSGWDVLVEGNDYQVYRHRIMDSKYFSVDGEGILAQECCGGSTVRGATINNNQGNAYIGIYKIPVVEDVLIKGNRLRAELGNAPLIYVSADTNYGDRAMNNVRIEDNQIEGGILAKASAGGQNNYIRNNQGNNSGAIVHSCHVQVSGNRGFQSKPCESSK